MMDVSDTGGLSYPQTNLEVAEISCSSYNAGEANLANVVILRGEGATQGTQFIDYHELKCVLTERMW